MIKDEKELERWDIAECHNESFMIEDSDGKYVLHSQAAAVIAAKDAEFNKLESAWFNAEGKISDLENELAQIKAQIPAAYMSIDGEVSFNVPEDTLTLGQPLYAAPVASEAEEIVYWKSRALISESGLPKRGMHWYMEMERLTGLDNCQIDKKISEDK